MLRARLGDPVTGAVSLDRDPVIATQEPAPSSAMYFPEERQQHWATSPLLGSAEDDLAGRREIDCSPQDVRGLGDGPPRLRRGRGTPQRDSEHEGRDRA